MIKNVKHSKFWKLALGLLLFGVGQRLLFTGVISPWARDTAVPMVLTFVSLILVISGFVLIIPIGIWFYKNYRSDKRLNRAIIAYLLSAIVCGIMIGLLGQLIYDYTSFTYMSVKVGIWTVSTMVQLLLKIIFCFVIVSIYRKRLIKDRMNQLWLPLALSIGLTAVILGITFWLPLVGPFIVSVSDSIILMTTLYYFMYLTKENIYEKTS